MSAGGVVETISRTPLVSLGNVWILRRLIILWNINVKKNLILDPFLGRKGPIFGSKKLDFCRIFGSKSDQKEDEGRSFESHSEVFFPLLESWHCGHFWSFLTSFLEFFYSKMELFCSKIEALLLQKKSLKHARNDIIWSSFAPKFWDLGMDK